MFIDLYSAIYMMYTLSNFRTIFSYIGFCCISHMLLLLDNFPVFEPQYGSNEEFGNFSNPIFWNNSAYRTLPKKFKSMASEVQEILTSKNGTEQKFFRCQKQSKFQETITQNHPGVKTWNIAFSLSYWYKLMVKFHWILRGYPGRPYHTWHGMTLLDLITNLHRKCHKLRSKHHLVGLCRYIGGMIFFILILLKPKKSFTFLDLSFSLNHSRIFGKIHVESTEQH